MKKIMIGAAIIGASYAVNKLFFTQRKKAEIERTVARIEQMLTHFPK